MFRTVLLVACFVFPTTAAAQLGIRLPMVEGVTWLEGSAAVGTVGQLPQHIIVVRGD